MKILKHLQILDEFEELSKIVINSKMPETPKGNKSCYFHFSNRLNKTMQYRKSDFVQNLRRTVSTSKKALEAKTG